MRPLVIAFVLVVAVRPAHALGDEERAQLVEHFGKLQDLQDFSATAVNAALDDEEFKNFFDGFGKVITVVQVADKIADAKDVEAMKIVAGELAKGAMEEMAKRVPALATGVGAFNFVSWVNTGLGLFKDFVFDPYLEKSQFETYAKLRGALDPEDAAAKTFGWGYMREKALKQLEKQGFNMDLLWENGEKGKLSRPWEAKLQQFVVASFEAKFERKLLQDAAKEGKRLLPGLDKQAKQALAKHAHDAGDEGAFVGDVVSIGGKKLEIWINGKPVAKGQSFAIDKANAFVVRVQVVGPRRQQARDLKVKHPPNVTISETPTDWAFAYAAGKNDSSWKVTDEHYDWKIEGKRGKLATQTRSSTHAGVREDQVKLVVAADTVNETITLDVSGAVKWEMTGTRANGAAHDSADESETGSIVVHVAPRK